MIPLFFFSLLHWSACKADGCRMEIFDSLFFCPTLISIRSYKTAVKHFFSLSFIISSPFFRVHHVFAHSISLTRPLCEPCICMFSIIVQPSRYAPSLLKKNIPFLDYVIEGNNEWKVCQKKFVCKKPILIVALKTSVFLHIFMSTHWKEKFVRKIFVCMG